MFETPTIEKTYKGTWKEVLSHREEIPDTSQVEVRILNGREEDGEDETRFNEIVAHFFAGVSQIAEKEHRPVDEVGVQIAEELLRQSRFPEIEFREILGERVACVKGRLEVWQVIMIAREYGDDIRGIADHLVLQPEQVQAALGYYAAYPDEIDAALAENDRMTYEEMKRRYPWMKIGLTEITDKALERLDREYPSLKDLAL